MAITLTDQWEQLKLDNPGLRIRNAAEMLGVSELELLLTQRGREVTLLRSEIPAILAMVPSLGYVMALTRNDDCVIECKGVYKNPMLDKPHAGVFVGEEIDLRMFFNHWQFALAVDEKGDKKSLQFFSGDGIAVHKIFLNAKSDHTVFDTITERFSDQDESKVIEIKDSELPQGEIPDEQIDAESFRHEWLSLRDTHEFSPIVHKYGMTRAQALRLAPVGGYAIRIDPVAVRSILNQVVNAQVPIMVFVGNKGMLQIFAGHVYNIVDHGEWLNILDPEFNLHLKEKEMDQCWIVRKPTLDGIVTGIECFNSKGEQIVQFFGKRKPGVEELLSWREIVDVHG